MAIKTSALSSATNIATTDLIQVVDVNDTTMAPTGTNKKATAQVVGNNLPVVATGSTTSRKLKDRFADTVNVKDFGAAGDGIQDDTAAFQAAALAKSVVQVVIPAGTYKLLTNPTTSGAVTWVVQRGASFTGAGTIWSSANRIVSSGDFRSIESDASFYNGIFGYLEQNATKSAYGTIGFNGVARTAGGNGGASEADIAIAGFAVNDRVGGLGGAWALYGTAIRQSGVTGPTHGLELDIANMGTTVPLFPSAMGGAGQTHGLWVATGGEATNIASVGTASLAIGIVRNDSNSSPSASFEKGIVFHNVALSGCDGYTGNGIAIAMASGHQLVWYNNSSEPVAEIVANNKLTAKQQRIDFNDSGILFQDRNNGRNNLQVENNTSGVNYFSIKSGVSTHGPHLKAMGDDPAIDIWIEPKGGGVLGVTYGTSSAATPANFSATRRLAFKDGNNVTWYIPVSTVPW